MLKARSNLDPWMRAEITDLQCCMNSIEKMLNEDSGRILVNGFGIWGLSEGLKIPLGYNAWLENDGKFQVGSPRAVDTVRIGNTSLRMKAILPPSDFWSAENKAEVINRNRRAMLERFGLRVILYDDRIEVRGAIPPQVIQCGDGEAVPDQQRKPITPSPNRGEGDTGDEVT